MVKILLERVGDEHEHLLPLVEQQHEAEVPDALLGEARGGDELEALHLAEVGGVPEHVDEHELGHVPVAVVLVPLADGRPYRRALPPHHRPLLRRRLARAYRPYHVPEAGAGGEGVDGEVHGEVLDDLLDGIQGGATGEGSRRRGAWGAAAAAATAGWIWEEEE